ncbi:MAG TPA: hypothetical protein VH277_15705 [Gemmatimonadaceae bacterium]|nr:hypothetical protein [Gemmatimonadaceae bacterium]
MRPFSPQYLAVLAAASLVSIPLAGCGDATRVTTPALHVAGPSSLDRGGDRGGDKGDGNDKDQDKDDDRRVKMFDGCDPATFNVPPGPGPGTCLAHKGPTETFADFIAELQATGVAANWKFAPPRFDVEKKSMIQAMNVGGEVHTFTRVAEFGGGMVPPLNTLSHNPIEAPECKTLEQDDFVPPGGTYDAPIGAHDKTVKFQCCIHPWMRSVVKVDE